MAYTWTESPILFGSTTVKKTHIDELRTNTNTERGARALGNYSWAATITQNVTIILASHFTEVRTALNQAYDANHCDTVCTTHYSTNKASNYSNCALNFGCFSK